MISGTSGCVYVPGVLQEKVGASWCKMVIFIVIRINDHFIFRVKCALKEFFNRMDQPYIQSFDEFPDGITLSNAIAAWKCIVDYQEKAKQS